MRNYINDHVSFNIGHVWVWQRNNDWGTVSFPFLQIVTRELEEWERERRNNEPARNYMTRAF